MLRDWPIICKRYMTYSLIDTDTAVLFATRDRLANGTTAPYWYGNSAAHRLQVVSTAATRAAANLVRNVLFRLAHGVHQLLKNASLSCRGSCCCVCFRLLQRTRLRTQVAEVSSSGHIDIRRMVAPNHGNEAVHALRERHRSSLDSKPVTPSILEGKGPLYRKSSAANYDKFGRFSKRMKRFFQSI